MFRLREGWRATAVISPTNVNRAIRSSGAERRRARPPTNTTRRTNGFTSFTTRQSREPRSTRLTAVTSNPNYEQFDGRSVPFGGDYLWITSMGTFSFGAWTDWRNTVAGVDQREAADEDNDGADVLQCRTPLASGGFTGDKCPRNGGLDQDIYGALTP